MEVTATPLVRDVADAIKRKHNQGFEAMAQAALEACHTEELARLLAQSATELDSAAEVLAGQDLTGLSSIFTEAASRNRALLAKLESPPSPVSVLGYCPICGAPGRSREKRPFGDDHCEAGHSYPSSGALPAKPEVRS